MQPNYDQATADSFRQQFASIAPTEASGGFTNRLYGQQSTAPVAQPKQPNFFQALGSSVLHGIEAAPDIAGKIAHAVFVEPFTKTATGIAYAIGGANIELESARRISEVNNQNAILYSQLYRAGKISKEKFDTAMADVVEGNKQSSSLIDSAMQHTNDSAARDFVINSYASVLTPLTMVGGLGAQSGRLVAGTVMAERGGAAAADVSKFVPRVAAYLNQGSQTIEQIASKVPTISKMLNTTPEAQSASKIAFNVLVKNPAQMNLAIRDPIGVWQDAAQGKYGQAFAGAALIGLMPFAGGPLGIAEKYAGKIAADLKLRAFGKTGFVDEIGKIIKDDPIKYLDNLKSADPEKYKESLQAWKTFEAFNSNHFGGDVKAMVENIAEWHAKHSNPLGNYDAEGLTNYWIDFKNSLSKAQQLAKDGQLTIDGVKVGAEDFSRVGLGKFGTEEKYALIKEMQKFSTVEERQAVINAMIADGSGWAQSPTMRDLISNAASKEDFAKEILKVKTGRAIKIAGADAEGFPRNYFPIFLNKNAKGYDTQVLENIDSITTTTALSDVLDRSIAPKGIASAVGGFFEKLGLSPQDRNAQAYLAIRRNIGHNLLDAGITIDPLKRGTATDSDFILQKLGEFSADKKSVFDLRQLRVSEIKDALGVGTTEAQGIRKAIFNAYTEIPLQIRGLGNKALDFNMKYNPFAAQYSRTQGALRYAYNPFFATQEVIETETLAQALVGGKRVQLPGVNTITNIFRHDRAYLDDVAQQVEKKGIFSAAAGRGEFASDSVTGGISAHLRPAQRTSIAGFIDKLAQKRGLPVDQYLEQHGEEAAALARSLVQYPKKSALNSPLGTTLNLVAFPARYNIKVTQMAVHALAQQSPLNQVLVLNSVMNMGDWLNSDEGQGWQSRNAEAIGLFKYFTPINTIGQISKLLTGNAQAASDYGSLGGLPFGVIGQILDHQGIINMSTPYINPRTGAVLPEYVPKTAQARVKTALDDMIASVFSYPGRMIGGPSKGSLVDTFTKQVPGIGVKKSDATQFTKVDRSAEVDAVGQHKQAVIREANNLPPQNPTGANANPFADYSILPPGPLKPLVNRQPDQSIDAALAAKHGPAGPTGPKPRKVYTARPMPQ
jgi:hypothetical protein